MYENPFTLEIIAPDRVVYRGPATSLSAPGVEGNFQVLFNHAPLLALLEPGQLKVKSVDGTDTLYAVTGGVVEVRGNRVVVLAEAVERAEDIDVARARAARERAERRLHGHDGSIDAERAKLALLRALNRIRTAGKA